MSTELVLSVFVTELTPASPKSDALCQSCLVHTLTSLLTGSSLAQILGGSSMGEIPRCRSFGDKWRASRLVYCGTFPRPVPGTTLNFGQASTQGLNSRCIPVWNGVPTGLFLGCARARLGATLPSPPSRDCLSFFLSTFHLGVEKDA